MILDSLQKEIYRPKPQALQDLQSLGLSEPEILWDRRRTNPESDKLPFDEIEKRAILNAFEKNKGNIQETAVQLGISRATLYRKIKKYRSS